MSPLSVRRGATAFVIAAAVAFTTACAGSPEAETTPSSAPSTATPVAPTAEPSDAPTTGPIATPECSALISAVTVADFENIGWTSQEDVFRVGSLEIPDGVTCVWGDFTTASDHIQMFGWAPISADDAEDARAELVVSGWVEESSDNGVFVTESSDTAISVDDEGYGQTYEFGDGWVTFADTKQGLLLIERPQG